MIKIIHLHDFVDQYNLFFKALTMTMGVFGHTRISLFKQYTCGKHNTHLEEWKILYLNPVTYTLFCIFTFSIKKSEKVHHGRFVHQTQVGRNLQAFGGGVVKYLGICS